MGETTTEPGSLRERCAINLVDAKLIRKFFAAASVIAIAAFSLCTVLFLPVLLGSRRSLVALRRRPGDLLWVNITTACAWLGFLYALKLIEPTIVQILYSGIGPLSVIWIERYFSTDGGVRLSRSERIAFLGLFAALMFSRDASELTPSTSNHGRGFVSRSS